MSESGKTSKKTPSQDAPKEKEISAEAKKLNKESKAERQARLKSR